MAFRDRREKQRNILSGLRCIRSGSVYDAISIRIAEDLGFEVGMFGGSVASLAVLGDPDVALITLTELAEQMRRMSRAAALPVLVDADHGYGNALNVRRTVQELEAAGAGGLTIEDTLLPQAFGEAKTQLISLEEGVGKMKAAVDGRGDPSLVIISRTGAISITSLGDAIERARAYNGVASVLVTADGGTIPEATGTIRAGTPLHGPNLFPVAPVALREAVLEYMAALTGLGHRLMAGLALSLGLEEPYFADRLTAEPLTLFRIFNYPPPADPSLWGVGEHTDYGLLTILLQDDAGGL